jgi:Response regulator containing CheY-like receiver domain and AraC-type DNA-binding domain
MIKILIADDEPHFRDYMKTVLDWNDLGFEISDIVKNGEEALRSAEKHCPDIALLDINMPRMDGLTLTERLKRISKDMFIVFITGYSEFDYARKALQLGVDEYILKPFSKEELANTVEKLKLKIQMKKSDEKVSSQDRLIVRGNLLNKLTKWTVSGNTADFMQKLRHVDIDFPYPTFLVSVVEIDNVSEMWAHPGDIDLWKFGISNIIQEILPEEGRRHFVFNDDENRVLSLLNFDGGQTMLDFVQERFQTIRSLIAQHFEFTITVGIGNCAESLEAVHCSCRDALIAAQDRFVSGPSRVICFKNLSVQNQNANFYRLDINDQLLGCLRRNDTDGVKPILIAVKEDIRARHLSADYAYTMIIGMLSICFSYISEMNCGIEEILGNDFSPYQELYKRKSLDDCFLLLENVYLKTLEEFKKTRSRKASTILKEVEAYIAANFQDMDLTADAIATELYYDTSYIRKLFSKYMDCTITDYITSARMKAAAALMEKQELSVSEISEKVGYRDSGYFGKCFKKYYGVSPKVYLSRLLRGKTPAL